MTLFLYFFAGEQRTDLFSRVKKMEERILYLESLSPEYFRGGIVSIKTAIVHFKKVKYYFIMILVKMLFSLRMFSDFFPPYFCQEKN